jgi:hypothetical protein
VPKTRNQFICCSVWWRALVRLFAAGPDWRLPFTVMRVDSSPLIPYQAILQAGSHSYLITCHAQSRNEEPLRVADVIKVINHPGNGVLVERTTDSSLDSYQYLLCNWRQIPNKKL